MECKHIAVLLKIVPDPDGLYEQSAAGEVASDHLPQIPSVFDENALEAALQLKEQTQCRVTALCLGQKSHEPSLKRALAMGADEIVLLENDVSHWDSAGAAVVLAGAIGQLDAVDLVLCGREAADTGAGLVGPYVAQLLNMPFLTLITGLTATDEGLAVTRPCEGGHDEFRTRLPVLLTVTGEVNRPRMPSVMNTMKARKTPARVMQVESEQTGRVVAAEVRSRRLAEMNGSCEILTGETVSAAVSSLLTKLREERVI